MLSALKSMAQRKATQKDLHLPQQMGFSITQKKDIKHLSHILVLPSIA